MEQVLYLEKMDGLMIDHRVRDYEYSMVDRHMHDTYECYYLLEGERYYFIEKQTYLVKAGDVVLIKPHRIHKTSLAGKSRHSRILMQIEGELMDTVLAACGLGDMDEFYGEDAVILPVLERERQRFDAVIEGILSELRERQRRYQLAVKLGLVQMFLMLSRYRKRAEFDRANPAAQSWKYQKVHEVADYLLNHPETSEDLEELARRFFVSRSYLSRIFRQVTSFTVNEYRNVQRIRKAQELLADSGYSITEISSMLGFENLTYFERVFKKYSEMTPLRYRKSRGKR